MKLWKRNLAALLSLLLLPSAGLFADTQSAAADPVLVGYLGDLDFDQMLSVSDVVLLQKYLINEQSLSVEAGARADLTEDTIINAFDLALLKRCLLGQHEWIGIYADAPEESTFIDAPISAVSASLPTQDAGKLVIFCIEFPDCTFSNKYTTEQVEALAFGEANASDANYPFESMSAFYERASKGSYSLSGNVFNYTAQESISVYNDDKVKIVEECYEAFKESTDFSQYDANQDGRIDATVICVPESANSDYWWPCSGAFGDPSYSVDGVNVGNIITGYVPPSDSMNFNSTYLHEMGHCMGLPDYYLYYSSDAEGMHGEAGTELMDTDAFSDFCAFSKLMLGWYKEDQISVYDSSLGAQTFQLQNAQTDAGNCVIIPYGDLNDQYFSEYFIIEYATGDGNNSAVSRLGWQSIADGICVFHVDAELFSDYGGAYLKYQNGSYYTNYDDAGKRLIRLVNDGGGVFTTGAQINAGTSGFGWYDSAENESIDPGVSISVGDLTDAGYAITISPN